MQGGYGTIDVHTFYRRSCCRYQRHRELLIDRTSVRLRSPMPWGSCIFGKVPDRPKKRRPNGAPSGRQPAAIPLPLRDSVDGRGWVRTSDLSRVRRALSR
jgi:hypothetical protein